MDHAQVDNTQVALSCALVSGHAFQVRAQPVKNDVLSDHHHVRGVLESVLGAPIETFNTIIL